MRALPRSGLPTHREPGHPHACKVRRADEVKRSTRIHFPGIFGPGHPRQVNTLGVDADIHIWSPLLGSELVGLVSSCHLACVVRSSVHAGCAAFRRVDRAVSTFTYSDAGELESKKNGSGPPPRGLTEPPYPDVTPERSLSFLRPAARTLDGRSLAFGSLRALSALRWQRFYSAAGASTASGFAST